MATKDFRQDLAAVRQRLDEQRLRQQVAARAQRAQEAERQRDSRLFRDAVGDAVLLAPVARAPRVRPPAAPHPLKALPPTPVAAVARLSDGPADGAEGALDTRTEFARDGLEPGALRRLRRGDWPVSGQLDLHGMTRDQARDASAAFVGTAFDEGWRCVRIIHGKGLGSTGQAPVLKGLVRRWLRQIGQVLAFCEAPAPGGGGGALLILLKAAGPRQAVAH